MSTSLPASRGALPPLGRFAAGAALSPAGPPHARPPEPSASAACVFSALPFLARFAGGASAAPASAAPASAAAASPSSSASASAASPPRFFLPLVASSVKRFRRAC